jgi:hypothetical protein
VQEEDEGLDQEKWKAEGVDGDDASRIVTDNILEGRRRGRSRRDRKRVGRIRGG